MPAGCRFRSRCTHAVAGCEQSQPMIEIESDRTARCWRAPELVLPGAVN
jgi:peptide/nickel transport system ATP-binding protein